MLKNKSLLKDILLLLAGTGIMTLSMLTVVLPNNLASSGMSGLAVLLYQLFAISPSLTFFLINIPLLIIGFRFVGKKLFFLTIIGSMSISVWMEVWSRLPMFQLAGLGVWAGLLDGVLGGIAVSLVLLSGGSSGGSAIIAVILHHVKDISMSKSILILDILVLTAALVTFLSVPAFAVTMLSCAITSLIVKLFLKTGKSKKKEDYSKLAPAATFE